MIRLRTEFFRLILALFITISYSFFGCQIQQPSAPELEKKLLRATAELTFLKPVTMRLDKAFTMQEYIAAAAGGTMRAGNDTSGYSSLFFKPGDLAKDTTIVFSWDSRGYITEFLPHGIVFNTPVEIHLSYKDADLSQVSEDSLRIWYYDESAGGWELVGGTVNKTEKRVEGFIEHFSRYAVAAE